MLIVDQYDPGTFRTASIIEEVDVYYAQEIFYNILWFQDFYFYNILWFQDF